MKTLDQLHSHFPGVHADVIAQGLYFEIITKSEANDLMDYAYGPVPRPVELPVILTTRVD